jgi:hypothetical protein
MIWTELLGNPESALTPYESKRKTRGCTIVIVPQLLAGRSDADRRTSCELEPGRAEARARAERERSLRRAAEACLSIVRGGKRPDKRQAQG